VIVGDRLGFYRALAEAGSGLTADEVARRTDCHPRLTREWLDGQAGAGLVSFDPEADSYALSPEAALVLAHEDSPAFLAGGTGTFEAIYHAIPKLMGAFKGNGGLAWGDHHESLYAGVARFFRPGYRTNLVAEWIPAMDGVAAKLADGGAVADIGCGFGHSCTVLAEAFPKSEIWGFDFHAPSVEAARANVAELGLGGRVQFDVASSTSYHGSFDLICFFDCLHDMGDPVGIAHHARSRLAPGGSVLLVEPFALDGRAANLAGNPAAAFFYHASTFLCTPSSLAQDVGRGMGAQSGESGMRAVFEEAGFSRFERIKESPFNIVYQARA
ncbi:MAG: class I SAM-dependent methyltransferase, partial [Acidimicrobiia bacterium]|nr:class I SAM-dependent methyltransferase [Acidimicrobiia bacterium]